MTLGVAEARSTPDNQSRPANASNEMAPHSSTSPGNIQDKQNNQQPEQQVKQVEEENQEIKVESQEAQAQAQAKAEAYEETHVHNIYQTIAPHFSSTRHSPWPLVTTFLLAQRPGSVGIDVGCGNGKYLRLRGDVFMMGMDRSEKLVSLAADTTTTTTTLTKSSAKNSSNNDVDKDDDNNDKKKGTKFPADVLIADSLSLPHRSSSADFAICIAVIHHLSTPTRRRAAIASILRCLKPTHTAAASSSSSSSSTTSSSSSSAAAAAAAAKALIFVWALEQRGSRRGWDRGCAQDTLVPWVMQRRRGVDDGGGGGGGGGGGAGGGAGGDASAPPHESSSNTTVHQRYYHLYREGELQQDVVAAGGLVLDSGYEKDNWWVICCRDDCPK